MDTFTVLHSRTVQEDSSLVPDVKIADAFGLAAVFDIYEDCCSMF